MAAKLPIILIFSLLIVFASGNPTANPEIDSHSGLQLMNETLEWEFPTQFHLESELVEEQEQQVEEEDEEGLPRRSLYWKSPARKYYISYGALSANRVPCPPAPADRTTPITVSERGAPCTPTPEAAPPLPAAGDNELNLFVLLYYFFFVWFSQPAKVTTGASQDLFLVC
ncbi:protein RALF-like 34 [Sesamum angolense]|uniref:Protein RALF-like 34 n=1 Tax=Sesamum angolense TaxID=2727404 RepID=A0AAE1T405_9LAMI|nr:protein RALF-like 34 [Sesamum angolense]